MATDTTPYAEQPAGPVAYDLDLATLERYRPHRDEPADFDVFWKQSLAAHQQPPSVLLDACDADLSTLDIYDVTFAGLAGSRSRPGW